MEIKHLRQVQESITPSQRGVINRLISLLDVEDMRQQTIRFKALFEDVNDDNLDSFYGIGYVLQAIINSNTEEKNYFIDKAEVVAGLINEEEAVWIFIGSVYIYANGIDVIEVSSMYDESFLVSASVPVVEVFDKFFAVHAKAYQS